MSAGEEPAAFGDDGREEGEATLPARPSALHLRDNALFLWLLALALAAGLSALPPEQRDLRYMLLWLALAAVGVLAWLLGESLSIGREAPEDLAWGLIHAVLLTGPLLAFGGNLPAAVSLYLFGDANAGSAVSTASLLATLIFVMPLAETLFFRGLLQQTQPFWLTGLMASLWSALLFLPALDVGNFPAISALVALALLMMNLLYSYVRARKSLAAAWICQLGVNLGLVFLPWLSLRPA